MSVQASFESFPVLIVAPLSALALVSAHQDWKVEGSVSPTNYSLWLGGILPFGWACALAEKPLQLASMIAVLVVYCFIAAKLFLPASRSDEQSKEHQE